MKYKNIVGIRYNTNIIIRVIENKVEIWWNKVDGLVFNICKNDKSIEIVKIKLIKDSVWFIKEKIIKVKFIPHLQHLLKYIY
jgi:hypothetical protein